MKLTNPDKFLITLSCCLLLACLKHIVGFEIVVLSSLACVLSQLILSELKGN